MKTDIETLRNSFKVGYDAYEGSRKEANEVWDLYHNRQYTTDQLSVLANRGQPAETYNVIKMFTRMLVGYYSTVVNTVTVGPRNPRDLINATVLNDAINFVFEDNRFDIEGDEIKLGGLISGLMCAYVNVEATGATDEFGRSINRVSTHAVPDYELVLDSASTKDDYSDARFLHRFRWMTSETVAKTFGKDKIAKMDAYNNFLDVDEADFDFRLDYSYNNGTFRVFDNYLVVHTVIEDDNDKRWSIFWSGDVELLREEITYKEARWPYRVQRLHSSNKTEYYGIFREAIEGQRALNQAVIKIQLMLNSEKAFVQEGAVENIENFTNAFNRVNAVVQVKDIGGIKIEKLSRDILDQYTIIDNALNRIQRVLGINDSFLGMAFASDSGRKVKLQQNQTVMSLRYITARIETFYKSLGYDIAYLIKQYYYANQILAITDELTGTRWVELNAPMMQPVIGPGGQPVINEETGEPQMEPILMPVTDPANGKVMEDAEGNIILAPIPTEETDVQFTEFTIKMESNSYNDEDEKAQMLLETVMSGNIGSMLTKVNPAGFFTLGSLTMRSMKTKYSPDIVAVLDQTAQMLSQAPDVAADVAISQRGNAAAGAMSRDAKLPTNTNEA